MKRLWLYRYSILAIGLAGADLLVIFGATSSYWGGPPIPHSDAYQRLASLGLGLITGSLGFAGLALAREKPKKIAFVAIAVSWTALFLCGMRMAL